jgi:hypothetical protein
MRESISESIISTVRDLNKSGLVDEVTMKNIESLCEQLGLPTTDHNLKDADAQQNIVHCDSADDMFNKLGI